MGAMVIPAPAAVDDLLALVRLLRDQGADDVIAKLKQANDEHQTTLDAITAAQASAAQASAEAADARKALQRERATLDVDTTRAKVEISAARSDLDERAKRHANALATYTANKQRTDLEQDERQHKLDARAAELDALAKSLDETALQLTKKLDELNAREASLSSGEEQLRSTLAAMRKLASTGD